MNLFEYTDYRKWLLDYYQQRKQSVRGFSWREFASLCGYASPVYLKLVGDGKTQLSAVGVERVAAAVGFTGRELRYFRALVRFVHASTDALKKEAFAEMRELADLAEVQVVQADQYDYYSSWINPVIRELAASMPHASVSELAALVRHKITESKAQESLQLLQRLGMLQQVDGAWQPSSQSISSGDEISSLAVREMHRQMAQLAADSLDGIPQADRDISGVTMGVTQEAYERIRKEVAEFRRRIITIASETKDTDKVVRLNLQLFPLSHDLCNEVNP